MNNSNHDDDESDFPLADSPPADSQPADSQPADSQLADSRTSLIDTMTIPPSTNNQTAHVSDGDEQDHEQPSSQQTIATKRISKQQQKSQQALDRCSQLQQAEEPAGQSVHKALEMQNGQPSLAALDELQEQAQQQVVSPKYSDHKKNHSPDFLFHKLPSTPSLDFAKQSAKTTDMTPQQDTLSLR